MDTQLYEIWAWYVIGTIVILTRYAVRTRTVGLKGFQGDDYMSLGTLFFYTLGTAAVHIVFHTGQNVDVIPAIVPSLTEADIARLTYGSKLELVAWYSYTSLIWCMKFTMLFFYKRLTLGSLHNKMVKYLFLLCGVTYLIVFLTLSLGCYPIQMNWQVLPIPPWKCTFRPQLFVVVAAFNITTDAALLMIPIPMLWKLKIPKRKKIVISLILSSGIFVIAAAVIRVVYSLNAVPSASNINRWGMREVIIGIIAIHIPILRPLFTRAFWRWGPYDPTGTSKPWTGTNLLETRTTTNARTSEADLELGRVTFKGSEEPHRELNRSSSQERIKDKDMRSNFIFFQTTFDRQSYQRSSQETIPHEVQEMNSTRSSL